MAEGEKETWNMANATLQRFDSILKQSSYFSQTGQIKAWKNCLMDLRRNLYPFMTQKEIDWINFKFMFLPKGWVGGYGSPKPIHVAQVSETFDEIYMGCLSIMKKKGLLMPKTIDSGKSVIEM